MKDNIFLNKEELLKGENIMHIMKDPMLFLVEANKYKTTTEIKNDLELMKNIIHNDIIKILNKNSQEFMSLPSNLNIIENAIPILEREIKVSKTFVKKLLSEINTINDNTHEILINKINTYIIKNILKNNIEIEQLLNKIQKEITKYEKSENYIFLVDIRNKLSSNNDDINKNIMEDLCKNNSYLLYHLSQRIINISKGVWKIKAMLYNNYKRMCKISNSLGDFNNLIIKYGTSATCDNEIIDIIKNYSYERFNNNIKCIINQLTKCINQLSYIFLKMMKNDFLKNICENFILNQLTNYILNSCYILNYFDTFIIQFQEIYINYIEYIDFETYDSLLLYIKKNILENENVIMICKRIDEIDENILFFTKGIVEKILDIIKIKFPNIFLLKYCDIFIENYIKTFNFLDEIKKDRRTYEQYVLNDKIKEFLKNFETEAYVQYILNILENKINENNKNIIFFDKKYIFDNNFYWLKETINLIKIFKILFTSKFYISDCLSNYLSFIFKHFKNYICNIETFLLFLEENNNIKIGHIDKKKFNWSPTLSYNSIGFFLSDFLSLRKIFKTKYKIKNFIKNNEFIIPKNIGDIPRWIYKKLFSNNYNFYYNDDNNSRLTNLISSSDSEENINEFFNKETNFSNINNYMNNYFNIDSDKKKHKKNNEDNLLMKNEEIENIESNYEIKNDNKSFDENKEKKNDIIYITNCEDEDKQRKNEDINLNNNNNNMKNLKNIMVQEVKTNDELKCEEKKLIFKIGKDNKNSLKEKKKEMKLNLHIYQNKNTKKIIHNIKCINGFLKTLSKIVINTQKSFEDLFINKMFEICSSFLVYLHSLLAMYKMTNKPIPKKPSEQVDKIILPLISFKTFYKDIIADIIIEEIITKIVDKISDHYLQEIKNIVNVKISEQNEKIIKLNLTDSSNENDILDDQKIQRQIFLDVCHYEKICNEHFNINSNTNISMNILLNHFVSKN
ncbi:conserved Plasmodium protein, unknown function [Plasmodium gallinaceum]|uniref:COG complex component COG2 C-terminal domain-containing protein n=1 Tax=Plasmodium gallinaceum TaxID=5849 RepID=A0A1J1GZB1_PLAGA|nr:conserved Plasmodium protein, unknown function [Plasmodium gallinaceum]CRG96355.1 conserved Plasmodium protein, unknown function [Plasmodium gallinaceum]